MGMIGKTNGKVRIAVNKLYSKIRIVVDYLPHAALTWIIAVDYLYDNVRIVVSNLDSKVRVLGHYLNSAIQRDTLAGTILHIDWLSRYKHREKCEYETTY